jgi:16S rRNA G1207 methylase RsmC
MTADRPDAYFKQRIPFAIDGERFEFDVSQTLFSSYRIDTGTALLLRTIETSSPRRILDLGCGYGPIGITLARRFPEAHVTMADADLLAVRYARRNCELNGVTANTEVVGSVGLESVPDGPFDLIVSNIPAKIGDEAIRDEFVLGSLARLADDGECWFVVVSGLNRLLPSIARRERLDLKQVRKRSGHTVYRLRPRRSAPDE